MCDLHICLYKYIYIYTGTHVHTHIYIHIIYIYIYLHICMYMYIHTHAWFLSIQYTYIYIYILLSCNDITRSAAAAKERARSWPRSSKACCVRYMCVTTGTYVYTHFHFFAKQKTQKGLICEFPFR